MDEPIQFADILTPNELEMNIRVVKQMMMNKEMILGYVEPNSKKVRTVEEIRVRLFNHQIEVRSDFDREWKPISLTDILVR